MTLQVVHKLESENDIFPTPLLIALENVLTEKGLNRDLIQGILEDSNRITQMIHTYSQDISEELKDNPFLQKYDLLTEIELCNLAREGDEEERVMAFFALIRRGINRCFFT